MRNTLMFLLLLQLSPAAPLGRISCDIHDDEPIMDAGPPPDAG